MRVGSRREAEDRLPLLKDEAAAQEGHASPLVLDDRNKMAVTGTLHKVVFGGELAISETWSCGLHFLSPDPGPIDPLVFSGALQEWFLRPESNISSAARLNWIKCNEIVPATGDYADQSNSQTFFYPTAISGAGGSIGYPQMSWCVSTFTALARGLSSKGRFYPPSGNGVVLAVDGRAPAESAMMLAVSSAQLLTDINGAATGECVVFSKKGQLATEISGVRVGRVADNQQRRRKNLIEGHQVAAIS